MKINFQVSRFRPFSPSGHGLWHVLLPEIKKIQRSTFTTPANFAKPASIQTFSGNHSNYIRQDCVFFSSSLSVLSELGRRATSSAEEEKQTKLNFIETCF